MRRDRKQKMLNEMMDTDFAMFITALYIQSELAKSTMWNPLRVNITFFLEAGITMDQFYEWQDKSLLFLNENSVGFMCYDDRNNLKEIFAQDISIWIKLALRVALMGWQDRNFDDSLLKTFVCEKLVENKYIALRNAMLSYKKRVLRLDSLTSLTVCENNAKDGYSVTMNDINGELLGITTENGLDGVIFEIVNTTEQELVCNIHLLQIKIGECEKKITAGTIYSTGDTTMIGIYDKAQYGLDILANYLARVFITQTLRVANVHFTLLTSEHVEETAIEYANTAKLRWNGTPIVTGEIKDEYYFRQLDKFIDDTFTKYENKMTERPMKKRKLY